MNNDLQVAEVKLKQTLDEENAIRLSIESRQKTLVDIENQIKEANEELQAKFELQTKLENENKDIQNEISEKKVEFSGVIDAASAFKSHIQTEQKAHVDAISDLKETHKRLTDSHKAEIDDVVARHTQEQKDLADTEATHKRLKNEVSDRIAENQTSKREAQSLLTVIADRTATIEDLKREEESKQDKVMGLQNKANELTSEIAAAEQTLVSIGEQIENARASLDVVDKAIEAKKVELDGHEKKLFAISKRETLCSQQEHYVRKCFEIAGVPMPTEEKINS